MPSNERNICSETRMIPKQSTLFAESLIISQTAKFKQVRECAVRKFHFVLNKVFAKGKVYILRTIYFARFLHIYYKLLYARY